MNTRLLYVLAILFLLPNMAIGLARSAGSAADGSSAGIQVYWLASAILIVAVGLAVGMDRLKSPRLRRVAAAVLLLDILIVAVWGGWLTITAAMVPASMHDWTADAFMAAYGSLGLGEDVARIVLFGISNVMVAFATIVNCAILAWLAASWAARCGSVLASKA